MRIATHTIGCKLNFAETSHIARQFTDSGWILTHFHDIADLYVINTCTVTAIAEKKCRNAIRQAVALNPKATVAVIGCFAQNDAKAVQQIEGVDIILGNNEKQQLFDIVSRGINKATDTATPTSFHLAYSFGDRTRAFFKIQDGCDYFCTYCAIPFARGRSRSATIEETVAMAHAIAQNGAKEVVLTGVNTGTFGQHHGETFFDLLQQLDQVEGILRYRISSIEPNLITNEIVDFVAHSNKFLPHFHIPLQAGTDKVLRLMHRHYDTAMYAQKLEYIYHAMPDACIAADIMTGFYGETDSDFDATCHFIESLPISYLHVFTYSERPNTMALKMEGKVPIHVRRERSAKLHELSETKKKRFYESQHGKHRPVLWESDHHEGLMHGFTDNYIRAQRPYDAALVNTVTTIKLSDSTIVSNFIIDN